MLSFSSTEKNDFVHLLRNTAVETVKQELLFVGTENGKLLAIRDIIKKVRALQISLLKYLLYSELD